MNAILKSFVFVAVLAQTSLASAMPEKQESAKVEPPRVELAILLDTSGSMDGLLAQAKNRLWDVVNTMATARKHGVIPDLWVALYEYGKQSLTPESGWIRQIVPLSQDLDLISTELFNLTTNGGDEFCGQAISRAVTNLKWSTGNSYRAIFIAGNEPFTQGSVDYVGACKTAIGKGIIINTLHCGNEGQGRSGKWDHAALLSDGKFFNIDHNKTAQSIPTPQDARIRELNKKLNTTYVAYGRLGAEKKARQRAADKASESAPAEADVDRALSKGSGLYENSSWDLVDALEKKKVKLKDVKEDQLPKEMKKMTLKEREVYVEKKTKERKALQDELTKLGKERAKFIEKELKNSGVETFSSAVKRTLQNQMKAKGFVFEK